MAGVYITIGQRRQSPPALEQAIARIAEGLPQLKREHSPAEWAETQGQLGLALTFLGYFTKDVTKLKDGTTILKQAALVTKSRNQPLWTRRQNHIGLSLFLTGMALQDVGKLKEAINFSEQLIKGPHHTSKVALSTAYLNIANANMELFTQTRNAGTLGPAVSAYASASLNASRQDNPYYWGRIQLSMAKALLSLGKETNSLVHLNEAASAFQSALLEFNQMSAPGYHLDAQVGLSESMQLISEHR